METSRLLFLVAGDIITPDVNDEYGINTDQRAYLKFFQSPEGGCWKDNEIMCFDPNIPLWPKLNCIYQQTKAGKNQLDYCVFVFFGHGALDEQVGDTYIWLNPNTKLYVNQIKEYFYGIRTLFIFDNCRKSAQDELREGIRECFCQVRSMNDDYIARCKILYDHCFMKHSQGSHIIGYAASPHEYAQASENGGDYGQSLLSVAHKYIQNMNQNIVDVIIPFSRVHEAAKTLMLKKYGGEQHPQLERNSVEADAPFVVLPEPEYQVIEYPSIKEKQAVRNIDYTKFNSKY